MGQKTSGKKSAGEGEGEEKEVASFGDCSP